MYEDRIQRQFSREIIPIEPILKQKRKKNYINHLIYKLITHAKLFETILHPFADSSFFLMYISQKHHIYAKQGQRPKLYECLYKGEGDHGELQNPDKRLHLYPCDYR